MKKVLYFAKQSIAIIVATIVIFSSASISFAQTNEKEVVRVACGINRSLYLDENGKAQGYCKNYLDELANVNNWEYEYVECTMNESIEYLQSGKVDLIFPLQKLEGREKIMEFSSLCGGYQPICIFEKDDKGICYNDYSSFDGARMAITKGTSNEYALQAFAKEHNFSYIPVYINSLENKSKAVDRGDVDYIVASTVYDIDKYEIASVISYEPFYYAVKKGNKDLLNELNGAMSKIMIEQPELATNVYLNFLDNGSKVAHTEEEKTWIKENKKIVVGVYKNTPPLYHEQDGEENHGIYVDLLELLEEKIGTDIELYPIDRDVYAYDLLKQGKIDFVLGSNDASLKALDDDDFSYSSPILDYTTVTISKNNYIKNDDNKPVFILTKARQYWEQMIRNEYPNAVINYCNSAKDCLIAVQKGDADITLLNSWEFNYQSKNARFGDLIEWENHRIYADVVMASMSDADINMKSIVDKGICELTPDELNKIITINLNRQYDNYTFSDNCYIYKNVIIGSITAIFLLLMFTCMYHAMRKNYITKLEKSNVELKLANESKSSFLARMSHDIRTPMNVIIGMSRIASENNNPPDTNDCLNKINVSSEFLLGLVNDILDMERIESDKIQLNITPYSNKEFGEYINAVISPLCADKNIDFKYTYNEYQQFVVLQDKLRINQIYFNLLSNAVKFTPEGGTIELHTDITKTDNTVILDVTLSDNGIGMSEDFQKHMFEPFVQENQKITPVGTGTGLGLTIVKKLCDMMNMEISVKSELNKGTTFFIHGEYEIATQNNEVNNNEKVTENIDDILKGKKILVCEDHPLNQEIIGRLLRKKEMEVVFAENGKEGVETFKSLPQGTFNGIIMDIRMPVMDGLEATKQIRSIDRNDAKSIPIIALSANAYDEDVRNCKDAGMNEHLSKPIEPEKLYKTLSKYL